MTTPPTNHPEAEADTTPEAEAEAEATTAPTNRLRWLAFNAAAAAAGHLAIWSVTGDPMGGAHLVARMSASIPQLGRFALTGVAAWAGWKAARLVRLHRLPGGPALCTAAALGAASWGQGTAPLIADVMTITHPWSTLLAPLLAVAPLGAACWWLLDRNASNFWPPLRWVARIPLATVVLSSALYAPGALT
ncbi:hypothetical protein [Streptomyces sp. NPDC048650]|uniref:hypothetical protein n=1 Tax=unclassified Streptomyces TaxID=2593676 RepID=UPI00371CC096